MGKENDDLDDRYVVEVDTEYPFFENSDEDYYFYSIWDKVADKKAGEGICSFDDVENLESYLKEHVSELLQKKNVYDLHPLVRDLVLASVNSTYGMYFVEPYEDMTEDEREIYTEENLELLAEEVEKEGLEHYIEVGPLESYVGKDGELVPSGSPVIIVYEGIGTKFDLSEKDDFQKEKSPLDQQIGQALCEEKNLAEENGIERLER